jgi:hypothetical protein
MHSTVKMITLAAGGAGCFGGMLLSYVYFWLQLEQGCTTSLVSFLGDILQCKIICFKPFSIVKDFVALLALLLSGYLLLVSFRLFRGKSSLANAFAIFQGLPFAFFSLFSRK